MRIKYHYAYHKDSHEITKELDALDIQYKTGDILISFDIYNDNGNWLLVKKIMDNNNKSSVSENEFTKEEIESAEWLTIRSGWRWSYPQPEDEYQNITYDSSDYCDKCGRGLVQKDSFYLKNEPNWGKRRFLQPFWIEDELFVKNEIEEELKPINLHGFSFLPVRHYKSKEELETIKQIDIKNIYNDELIFNENDIDKKIVCSKCKKTKYVLFGHTIIKANRKTLNECNCDILKTQNVFGDGLLASKIIFISKKFAKYVLEKKLKEIILEPIQLI